MFDFKKQFWGETVDEEAKAKKYERGITKVCNLELKYNVMTKADKYGDTLEVIAYFKILFYFHANFSNKPLSSQISLR